MTPEMQKKRDELAKAYNLRINGEGATCRMDFREGFTAAHDLMQEKLMPLVAALRFYADEDQYSATDIIDGVEVMEISNDQGERAREALKGWE